MEWNYKQRIFQSNGIRIDSSVKVGIICGSGLDNADILDSNTLHEKKCTTPFGQPSGTVLQGEIKGVECVVLVRHGRGSTIMPSHVNYRANVWVMKQEGCTHLIVTSACGSLQSHISPGDFVILDQFIDRTYKRQQTFYDGSCPDLKGVCHISMDTPFCAPTSQILYETVKGIGYKCHPTGTVVTIEGPRFSSKAESKLWRTWGGDVINMTTVPEVVLAKEAGLSYAVLAMATDWDSWHESKEPVSVDQVVKTFKANRERAIKIIREVVPKIAAHDWTNVINENEMTLTAGMTGV